MHPLRPPGGHAMLALALMASGGSAMAAGPFDPHWPEGELAEEVGYFCSACHSTALISQQGLDRQRWDDVLQWMIEDNGMPELDPETYERYLDFLTESFPEATQKERVPGGG